MEDISTSNTFRFNIKWLLVGSASQTIFGGILLLVIGRELGSVGFGIFSIIMSYIYVANLLFEPRMQDLAAKLFWNAKNAKNDNDNVNIKIEYCIDLFMVEVLGKLVPCIGLILLAPFLTKLGNISEDNSELIIIAAIGTYFSKFGYGLAIGILRAIGRSDLSTYCATIDILIRVILTLPLIWFSTLTPLGCIVILCISGIISNTIQWLLVNSQFQGTGHAIDNWKLPHAINRLRDHSPMLLANLGLSTSDLAYKDLDILLIASLTSTEKVGIYKMTKNITMLIWRAIDPFYLALMPEMNRLVHMRKRSDLLRFLRRFSVGIFALSFGLSLVAYLIIYYKGSFMLGLAYSTIPQLMPLMSIGVVLAAPLLWGHPLAVALNRANIALKGSFIGLCFGSVAFLSLTPSYGIFGAALAWSLSFLLNFLFTASISLHHYNIHSNNIK